MWEECHRKGAVSPNAWQRLATSGSHQDQRWENHPLRVFGPRNTRKWKLKFARQNALKRINAHVGCDFLFDDHFIRGNAAN